jgi:hypothetical protein
VMNSHPPSSAAELAPAWWKRPASVAARGGGIDFCLD